MSSGKDWVIKRHQVKQMFALCPSAEKHIEKFRGEGHSSSHELPEYWEVLDNFITRSLERKIEWPMIDIEDRRLRNNDSVRAQRG